MSDIPILELRGISKSFGPTKALQDVDLTIRTHEVCALMGENGAGKSTLMKVLSGIYAPDAGTIMINGRPATIRSPQDARAHGINLIYQELSIARNMTVLDNVFLGSEYRTRWGSADRRRMRRIAQPVLDRLGVPFALDRICGTLSIAEQQQIEIARALVHNSKILVMDEPTSSLSERETEALFAIVDKLRSEGVAIIYITHRMQEMDRLADRVAVLRDGQNAGELTRENASRNEIVRMMVGRPLTEFFEEPNHELKGLGPAIVKMSDACAAGFGPYDLEIRQGEVHGVAGLVGAGRTELAHILFGVKPLETGRIELSGEPFAPRNPAEAMAAGVGLVPEDRKQLGLFSEADIRFNGTIASLESYRTGGLLSQGALDRASREMIGALAVRANGPDDMISGLSGGNQQKVILSRWMARQPRLFIFDEPTRGVDIGAKTEIYRKIREAAEGGAAVLFISSELTEIVGISDRVTVIRNGRSVALLTGGQITQEVIMMHAFDAIEHTQPVGANVT